MSEDGSRSSEREEATLAALLDALVPARPEVGVPGAGELGLARHLRARAPELVAGLARGLSELDALARARGGESFSMLPEPERADAVSELAARDPGFLPPLLFHVYMGYYEQPQVLEALGVPGRPPHPEGYEIGPSDLGELLEPVRRRSPLFRKV